MPFATHTQFTSVLPLGAPGTTNPHSWWRICYKACSLLSVALGGYVIVMGKVSLLDTKQVKAPSWTAHHLAQAPGLQLSVSGQNSALTYVLFAVPQMGEVTYDWSV